MKKMLQVMNLSKAWTVGGMFILLAIFAAPAFGQSEDKAPTSKSATTRVPMCEDWSSRYFIYSPITSPTKMQQAQKDPRYWLQYYRMRMAAAGRNTGTENLAATSNVSEAKKKQPPPPPGGASGDWSVSLGSNGAVVAPLMFPAKFSFDVNAAPSCTNDYAVFANDHTIAGAAPVKATGSVTFNGGFGTTEAGTVVIGNITYVEQDADSVTTPGTAGECFVADAENLFIAVSNKTTAATNLEGAINAPASGSASTYECNTATNTLVSATNPSAGVVDLTATAFGSAGNSIVLTSSVPASTLVPFSGGVSGGNQPSITGLDNLYSGGASFAYDIGTVTSNSLAPGGTASVSLTNTTNGPPVSATVTQSDPTKASQTGTFSGTPIASTTISITNSGNTLALKTNATGANTTGTFSSEPTTATTPVLTITSGSGTSNFETNATAAHATGTFSEPPQTNTTMSYTAGGNTTNFSTNGTGSSVQGTFTAEPTSTATTFVLTAGGAPNTTTFTTTATKANATGTFAAPPLSTTPAITLLVGATTSSFTTNATPSTIVGTFGGSPTSATVPTITVTAGANTVTATTNANAASAIGTFANPPASNTSITLTSGSNTVTMTSNGTAASSIATFTGSGTRDSTAVTLTNDTGGILTMTPGNGSANSCTSATTGTFNNNTNTTTEATNLAAAINSTSCSTTYSVGYTATSSGAATTVTATELGVRAFGVSGGNSLVSWSTASSGTAGSAACAGTAPTFTGTYAASTTTTTQAGNLNTAFGICAASVGFTSSTTGATVTVTSTTFGASTFTPGVTNGTGIFTWGTTTAGSNGSNTCAGTTAHFATSASTSTLATNLAAGLSACTTPGFTAAASGSSVTITDSTPGATGVNAFSASGSSLGTIYSWAAPTSGTNGSNACAGTTGTFATSSSTTTLASDLQASMALCTNPGFGATASGATVVATASALGANTFTPGGGAAGVYTWGTTTAGSNGTNTCCTGTAPTLAGTYAVSTSTTTLAENLAAAIIASTATGATASATTPTLTVTDLTAGSAPTFTVGGASQSGFFSWGAVTAGTNGSNACAGASSPFTGTFMTSATLNTLATNLQAAIALCPAGTNVTATNTGATVVVTNNTLGSAATLTVADSNNTGNFAWSTVTAGGNGSNTCTGGGPYTGTLAISTTGTTAEAADLVTAITACPAGAGISATNSGATVTVTDTTAGSASTLSASATGNTGIFTWSGTVNPGTNGSNTCPSSTTGTFATSASTATLAQNLAAAIALCPAGAGVTAAFTSGSTLTVTALEPGSSGNSIATTGGASGIFAWGGGDLAGGGDGTTSGTSFAYWSGSSAVSTDQLTYNICTALQDSAVGGDFGFSCANTVNYFAVKDPNSGSAANGDMVAENMNGFAWSSTPDFEGGTNTGICATSAPTVAFAYDTHTGATGGGVTTSPTLSLDGTKILYVESITGGSVLHVLRPKLSTLNGTGTEGTVAAPVVPTTVINGNTDGTAAADWASCIAGSTSCMFNLTFNATTVTYSTPWYDYAYDASYVGDDSGKLWKISGVFSGTPKLGAAPWPITVNAAAKLAAPVFDDNSGYIILGDTSGRISYVSITANCGATSPPCLGGSISNDFTSIEDPPVVDGTLEHAHFFGSLTGTGGRVVETTENLTGTPVIASVGSGTGTLPLIHAGVFDYEYIVNGPTGGSLWVCGLGAGNNNPTLYQIGFSASAMNSTADPSTLALGTGTTAATSTCSPLTEIYNPNAQTPTEWLFVGVPADCSLQDPSGAPTTTGCIESFVIGNGTTDAFPTAGTGTAGAEPGGTSGIVVDNVSSDGKASSVYFGTLGVATCDTGGSSAGCAVQRTQSGVQ